MRRVIAAIVLVAAVVNPAAAADRFGAMLVNVPLIVEHWDVPAVGIRNVGDVPISATVTIDGPGWAPAQSVTPVIAPGGRYDVRLTAIGKDRASVKATVTNTAAGMDRAVIVLESSARHESPWEAVPAPAWLLLALVVLVASWAVLRRLRARSRG